ncbi:MAG TPA: hypothetical protein VM367_10215 [Pseudonocardia sp.]|nr:hypothetical protein [Pseudonocardia sp.]
MSDGEVAIDPSGRMPRGASAAALLALVLFALVGIGGPLVGAGVFAATDELVQHSPYRDAGLAGEVQNTYLDDTWDTIIPNTLLFADALRDGEIAAWNPYILGGVPLGATPNFAVASPLTVPYYLLPGWLAPAWVKLVEIVVAAGGCFLYARRLGLARAPALLGGLVFVSSAFLVAWTNWPQTRTAAVIPFVFWALERIVQRRRAGDAAILAVAVAAMLFGGFPAVTGYALLAGAAYLVVRVLAEHRARRGVRALVAAGVGVLLGVALAAVQLVPFVAQLSTSLVEGRAQTPGDHLPHEALITALAPFALGTVEPGEPPPFLLGVNMVEALSYVGAAALVLVVVAVAAARPARALVPRGVWAFLVGAAGSAIVLIYVGGPPLAAAQELPVLFADNYVGRLRSVLGFLLAVLAAVGYAVLLDPRPDGAPRRGVPRVGTVAGLVAVLVAGGLWVAARSVARTVDVTARDGLDRVAHLDGELATASALVALAVLGAAALWWMRPAGVPGRRLGTVAAALLPLLVAGQALMLVRDYWPRSERATFYPVTEVHRFLAAELGHDRFAFARNGMAVGASSVHRLRALNGHTFVDARYSELVEALPGDQFGDPPTLPVLAADARVARAPVLDRLGVRYFVTAPEHPVLGVETPPPGGSVVTLRPGEPVAVTLTAQAPLRAVTIVPVATPSDPAATRVEVVLRDGDGRPLAGASRAGLDMAAGVRFAVPIPETQAVPATVEFVLHAPRSLRVVGTDGGVGVGTVQARDDGLRLVFAGGSVVYERETSLPRIRWASSAVGEPDPAQRLALVVSGGIDADTVVLDEPGDLADTGDARVRVLRDGVDEVVVEVDNDGAGWLVVADALQHGWRVEVDGEQAEVVAADHGLAAVAVPTSGTHLVRWEYGPASGTVATAVSVVAASALVAVLLYDLRYPRRRRAGRERAHRPGSPLSRRPTRP